MKNLLFSILLLCLPWSAWSDIERSPSLDVPIVEQGKSLCGPATLEMIFRYWGENDYSQYDIAKSLMRRFPDTARYKKSGILNTNPIDWSKYPGTGTINMREFLKQFGDVENIRLEHPPRTKDEATRLFDVVKENVSRGVPVIVHQYWGKAGSRGHYRIVTGYDDELEIVYLNDAHGAKRIRQSYKEFMEKWNVDQRWLHYNAIIFKPKVIPLDVAL